MQHIRCLLLQTRILVTHNISYLSQMDFIIVMKDGTVSESGTYEDLTENRGEFANFLATYGKEEMTNTADDRVRGKSDEYAYSMKSMWQCYKLNLFLDNPETPNHSSIHKRHELRSSDDSSMRLVTV